MTPKDTELMHRVLDEEASPQEQDRFNALLSSDSEARTAFDDLSGALARIKKIPLVDPPDGLRARIMASLPTDVAERRRARTLRPRKPSLLQRIRGLFGERKHPVFALAYAFSIGLLVGVGVYSMLGPAPGDVAGTLAPDRGSVIQADAFHGRVQVADEGDLIRVIITADAELPTDVALRFDEGMELTRFGQTGALPEVRSTSRSITIAADGQSEIDMTFRTSGLTAMELEISRDGTVLERESIP